MQKKLGLIAGAIAVLALAATGAQAQEKVKIGFVTDLSSLYADLEGKGGATAIQMAIDDFCLLYTSPSPRDKRQSRMPSSA